VADRPCLDHDCGNPDCYHCRLRSKAVQVSPRVQMNRDRNWKPTPSVPPEFNKKIVYEDRPGGFKSPVLRKDGTPLRAKEHAEKRHEIDDQLARIRAGK